MHEIVSFSKEIEFKNMINKITSISLEHTLMLENGFNIRGDFIVSGTYKMTAATRLENDFSYKIPVDIEVDDKYNIENAEIKFEGQSFKLPDAIKTNDVQDVELSFPVKALTLGTGSGIARIEWIEKIENQTLYFLKAGELTLFALEDNEPRYSISDIVKFDIDLSKINIPECNIKAVNLINRLDGSFIKLKNKEKNYDFFMNMEGMNITPSNRICEKLFACKGAKIFNTDLVYEFSLKDILVSKLDESENKLTGTVTKVYDYTNTRFVEIQIGNQMILAEYSGEVGDQVQVKLDVDKVTIIDKQIDIIIV